MGKGRPKGYSPYAYIDYVELGKLIGRNPIVKVSKEWLHSLQATPVPRSPSRSPKTPPKAPAVDSFSHLRNVKGEATDKIQITSTYWDKNGKEISKDEWLASKRS
tara:strand:+ start:609 stop:923 length:315 start_codon:yes stop_codon:yes gene_type:complete